MICYRHRLPCTPSLLVFHYPISVDRTNESSVILTVDLYDVRGDRDGGKPFHSLRKCMDMLASDGQADGGCETY
jgi:hypothetical protein